MADNPLTKKVRLYYLGGLSPEDSPTFVQSRGTAFQVPSVGGYIEIAMYHAQDLIQRSHNGVHPAWSMSPRDAEMAKAGTLNQVPVSIHDLSVDQLKAILAEKEAELSGDADKAVETAQGRIDIKGLVANAIIDEPESEESSEEVEDPQVDSEETKAQSESENDEEQDDSENKPARRTRKSRNSKKDEAE